MKRAHIIVSGVVQGVFYRAFTRDNAMLLRLVGWARNLPNGDVEITVEGNKKEINEFIKRLRKGPYSSRVDELSVDWEESKKEFSGFDIVR